MASQPSILQTPLREPLTASQVEFKLHPVVAPLYKFLKLAPSNKPTASVGLGSSSGDLFEWKLPAGVVYNLARSYFEYNQNAPGSNGIFNNSFEDVFDLPASVQFGAPGGQDLVNLQWAANYSKTARKLITPIDDLLTNSDMDGLYTCNQEAVDNKVPGGGSAGAGGLIGTDNFIEPKYTKQGAVGTAAAGAAVGALNRYRQIPLSVFPGTLLGVDRDFFSPTEMSLRINTNTGDKIMWTSSTVNDPITAAASVLPIAGSTQSSVGLGVTINNCYLYLCVEINQDIIKSMQTKYASGNMIYSVPYTTAFRMLGAAAGQQTNLQLQLSNLYGRKLKKITTTVWSPVERLNTAYDQSNVNGAKMVSYNTLINSNALQSRILSCYRPGWDPVAGTYTSLNVNMDDWLENRKFLDKRSSITSKESYQLNWFHIDQFSEPTDEMLAIPDVNLSEGLDMIVPITWQFTGITGATSQPVFYVYAEFQRDLAVTAAGAQYVGSI